MMLLFLFLTCSLSSSSFLIFLFIPLSHHLSFSLPVHRHTKLISPVGFSNTFPTNDTRRKWYLLRLPYHCKSKTQQTYSLAIQRSASPSTTRYEMNEWPEYTPGHHLSFLSDFLTLLDIFTILCLPFRAKLSLSLFLTLISLPFPDDEHSLRLIISPDSATTFFLVDAIASAHLLSSSCMQSFSFLSFYLFLTTTHTPLPFLLIHILVPFFLFSQEWYRATKLWFCNECLEHKVVHINVKLAISKELHLVIPSTSRSDLLLFVPRT